MSKTLFKKIDSQRSSKKTLAYCFELFQDEETRILLQ